MNRNNSNNAMKQTNISSFFSAIKPKVESKPVIEEGFDSFFDDVPQEELDTDLDSIPVIASQPTTASSASSQSSSTSTSSQPHTPSKLKLPTSFGKQTATNTTPTKPSTPSSSKQPSSSFSLVINDDEDEPKSQTEEPVKVNLFERFKDEPYVKRVPVAAPSKKAAAKPRAKTTTTTTTTTTTAAENKKRKEMDDIQDDQDDEDNDNNINKENNSNGANMDIDIDDYSYSSNKPKSSSQSSQSSSSTAAPKTPTRTTRKPVITFDSDEEEANDNGIEQDDDEDDDYRSSSSSKSTPSKPKGNAFGKKDKKELEDRYSFLVNIKDANGHPKDHPDYDKRTLHIPASCMSKFTPFERQFWDIKCKNYDTVVFFKKGKFYELYESDADIGHQQLHLKMTDRINMRMVGVPEMSFNQWASKLIHLGYKVAKVDQMETSIGMAKRQNEKGGRNKKDSIIQRELTSILTAGTLLDEQMITDQTSTYLMAIKESEYDRSYGVCFVDVSIGEFYLCSIDGDDENRMQFETLLLQMMPKEIVYEKGATSAKTLSILKRVLATVKPVMNQRSSLEYWDPQETLNRISEMVGIQGGKTPESLKDMKNETLLMCSLGGCISYLVDIKIGKTVVEQARFKRFNPLDVGNSLILDGQCLVNLEIFNNSTDGSTEGTLFKLMDRCVTSFGKRLFRQWICRPLANKKQILDRQKAIEYLSANQDTNLKVVGILNKLPDLERMIARIRAGSSKITDLISVLNHFDNIHTKLQEIDSIDEIDSYCLKSCLKITESNGNGNSGDEDEEQMDGEDNQDESGDDEEKKLTSKNVNYLGYPNLKPYIEKVRKSFKIENERLVPSVGVFKEFDKCFANISALEAEFAEHLQQQRKLFSCAKIEYKHMGKEIYQVEIPIGVMNKGKPLPNGYDLKSRSAKVQRYHTPFVTKNLPKLLEERDTLEVLSKDVLKKIQINFSVFFNHFQKAISRLAQLDCLLSLYKVSFQSSIPMCRPTFTSGEVLAADDMDVVDRSRMPVEQRGFVNVKDMRHPCIYSRSHGADDFIPNDIELNTESNPPSVMVLTGPNMGGKSTLLRQTCILVIMAQMGCYVSASSCEMSLVDRIFTRLGANDNILAGQSTFMVELAETCAVLKYATNRSLVILDELGRGTSTFDGYSIAFSVLQYIASQLKSMCIFATHYQSLAYEPSIRSLISTGYMTCTVNEEEKRVIFLYKLASGVCPNSYGLHVASMAGLDKEIIVRAQEKSTQMEKDSVLVSFIHGTINRSTMVGKIVEAFNQKDTSLLSSLSNTLKNNLLINNNQ